MEGQEVMRARPLGAQNVTSSDFGKLAKRAFVGSYSAAR